MTIRRLAVQIATWLPVGLVWMLLWVAVFVPNDKEVISGLLAAVGIG